MVYKILFIFLFLLSNLFASKNLSNLTSFKANFIQIVMNESNKTIEYKGKVFIKNSGKVLWKYETPIIKNVYILSDMAIIDEPKLEQAIYTNLEKEIDILKLLKSAKKVKDNLYKTKLYEIEYFITLNEGKVQSLSYKDELENKVIIKFLNIEENTEIIDSIFDFLAPDYYDIIKK